MGSRVADKEEERQIREVERISKCEYILNGVRTSCIMFIIENGLKATRNKDTMNLLRKIQTDLFQLITDSTEDVYGEKALWIGTIAKRINIKIEFIFPTVEMETLTFGNTSESTLQLIVIPPPPPEENRSCCRLGVLLH